MSLTEAKNLILAQTPLATLIGEAVTLHKQSGKLVGCCPFHPEKTGSFYIYDDHYHCYGCGAHGDAITYVRNKFGLSYVPALRWLAEKYAIPVGTLTQSAEEMDRMKSQAQQAKLFLSAQNFFATQLNLPGNREAQDYLTGRGFTEESFKTFGFGYAPNSDSSLHHHLRSLGFRAEELEQASLVTFHNERAYDFFRHRVIVPIHDNLGRLIAFGGRTLGHAREKYKNSRYHKGSVLFAMHRARQMMAQQGRALVVEGYFDALQLHLHGFTETVACQGTALTNEHLQQLNAAAKQVYLVFDGDNSGKQASLRIISLALNYPNLQFKVVQLPDGDDPDTLVRRGGSEALNALIASAEDLILFGIQSRLKGAVATAIPHLIHEEFIPWLVSIPQPITRSFLCRKIAELSGVNESVISQELNTALGIKHKSLQPRPASSRVPASSSSQPSPGVQAMRRGSSSSSSRSLPPLVFEMIGHLYFAKPGEVDIPDVREFVERELLIEEVWLYFIEELLICLAEGQEPATREPGCWVSSQNANVIKLISSLAHTPAMFQCQDRSLKFKRLQLIFQKNKVKDSIATLKKHLMDFSQNAAVDRETSRLTLQEIAQLNKKLYNIESLLQNG